MTTLDNVLRLLMEAPDHTLSGPSMAAELEVSRNAVWKAVNQLKEEGYDITSLPQKGYQLKSFTKDLDSKLIQALLPSAFSHWKVESYASVESTNDLTRSHLIDFPSTPMLVASRKQTEGRGRRGRQFYSELEEGLYFSIGFKPENLTYEEMPIYSIIAVLAIVQTLEKHLEDRMDIKWVNDIFYRGKKVAGILSEIVADLESGGIPNIIIGIGLNLTGNFDQADREVQKVAGSIFDQGLPERFNLNKLLAEFLSILSQYEADLDKKDFLSDYKSRLLGLDEEVYYSENGQPQTGIIRDLDDAGQLVVELPSGERKKLIGQEIHFSSQQFVAE